MRWLVLLLSLLPALMGAGLADPAASQTRLDEIVKTGVLRVGLTGDYRPFSQRDASGSYSGLDVDMAKNLADSLGAKLEIVPTTWGTLLPDLQAGKFDVGMGGISITLARQRVAFFSDPVMRVGKAPIARCTDKDHFATLAEIDRPGVKVIVNPGGTNERFDREHLKQAQIVVFPDNSHIFDELAAGHADVMITDAVETKLQQKLHPELCAIHPDQPFDFGELGYLLPRDTAWKLYVDQWLHTSVGNGTWGRLLATYLGN
ncbi:MAG TPA: transporter substrate-binding domain-containing protein [Rhodopila sp.]|uniref:transporter substrate-binding domain-containing protein n=1 Tax=Rhodopila sp. TaxID=2480087 RepID=UPI002BCAE3F1|nr:transporter substrate-binding domain-containing protein [Rhodopila sp.]HVY18186.1 transporter substrate-binding domain-containing protein [Rhodopila sp.]